MEENRNRKDLYRHDKSFTFPNPDPPTSPDDFWTPWEDNLAETAISYPYTPGLSAAEFMNSIDLFTKGEIAKSLHPNISPRCIRLWATRSARGLSQAALGTLAHVAESTIYRLEHESRRPRPKTRGKIAAALSVPETWLFQEDIEVTVPLAKPKLSMDPAQEGIPLITRATEDFNHTKIITITITPENEPKIYEALTAAAREERRTPDAQALHWLEKAALELMSFEKLLDEWEKWQGIPPKLQKNPEPSK
jgi:transcriptional regulator with XRE-family HTH domain